MRRALAVLFAGVCGVSLAGQQPAPTFRSSVNAVLLDTRVVDRDGNFVRNLTKDDFHVFEDGREQRVSTFALVDIPMTPSPPTQFAGTATSSDVASNQDSEGRLYMLVLDDQSVHQLRSATVRALATDFIENHVSPEDRVALTTTSGRADMTLEFTADKPRLLAAVNRFQGGFGDADSLRALRALADWLSFQGRRKSIVLISQGLRSGLPSLPNARPSDTPSVTADPNYWSLLSDNPSVFDEFDTERSGTFDLRDVIASAAQNNVAVYTIDPTGLPGAPAGGVKPVAYIGTSPDDTGDSPFIRTTDEDTLDVLSSETGGFSLQRSNDFSGAFTKIVEAESSYYLLGYVSSNTRRDNTFRHVSITMADSTLRVRTRTGYVAEKGGGAGKKIPKGWTTDLVDAIQSPVQISGFPMTISAASFRGTGKNDAVEVIVETRGNALQFAADGERSTGLASVAMVVADQDGHSKAFEHGQIEMHLSPKTRASVDQYGVRILSRLQVKPGRYILRIAGTDSVGVTKGSVHYTLDVPDFSKGPLTMSNVAVASDADDPRPTTGSDKEWQKRFASPPTASRMFTSHDTLHLFAEVYGNGKKNGPIDVTSTILSESDDIVFHQAQTLTVVPAVGKTGVAAYHEQAAIPLDQLQPGNYMLSVEAKDASNARASASRRVLFSVR